jgi:hypothetical protein
LSLARFEKVVALIFLSGSRRDVVKLASYKRLVSVEKNNSSRKGRGNRRIIQIVPFGFKTFRQRLSHCLSVLRAGVPAKILKSCRCKFLWTFPVRSRNFFTTF